VANDDRKDDKHERGDALPARRLLTVDTEIRQRGGFPAGTNVGRLDQLARTSLGPQP